MKKRLKRPPSIILEALLGSLFLTIINIVAERPNLAVRRLGRSTWMGNGGGLGYADNLAFNLIDVRNDQTVCRGRAVRRRDEDQVRR